MCLVEGASQRAIIKGRARESKRHSLDTDATLDRSDGEPRAIGETRDDTRLLLERRIGALEERKNVSDTKMDRCKA